MQEQHRKKEEICRAILEEIEHNLRIIFQHHTPKALEISTSAKFQQEFWLLPPEISALIGKAYSIAREENDLIALPDAVQGKFFRQNDLWSLLRVELPKLEDELRRYQTTLKMEAINTAKVNDEKKIELALLLRTMFDGLTILAIGKGLQDPYCVLFTDTGYDKDYKYYDEKTVATNVANVITDEQLQTYVQKYKNRLKSYRNFYGKHYTYDARTGALKFESAWPIFTNTLQDIFRKHGKATHAVLRAYVELRKDYNTWSVCDYNQLAYRAKELAGAGWKQALVALEIGGVIEKRGSGRRPGERSIAPEMIPLVQLILSQWEERPIEPLIPVPTRPGNEQQRTDSHVSHVNKNWDVFICHASEDKIEIARPLAEALRKRNLKVWYDEFTLRLGDSLRRTIDTGLGNSRFGVVILSPSFFMKNWPQKELDGLAAREDGKQKVILPVWHKVGREDVLKFSPTLADRYAVSTAGGLDPVVKAICEVVESLPDKTELVDREGGVEEREKLIESRKMSAMPTKPYVPPGAGSVPPASELVHSLGTMLVKIGTVEVREPDLTMVAPRGIGFPGFEFQGLAPEARGKQLTDKFEAEKGSHPVSCEAVMKNGKRISGYGTLEQFQSRTTESAPVMYRFSGTVTLLR